MRIFIIIAIVISNNFILAQHKTTEQNTSVVHELTINRESFGTYPAVILDIDTHRLIKLNNEATEDEVFKDIKVKNGFFIEPRDPEFSSISIKGADVNPRLITLKDNYEDLTIDDVKKLNITRSRLREDFKTGIIFIVKTHKGVFFKFQIVMFNKETEEIKLKYEKME